MRMHYVFYCTRDIWWVPGQTASPQVGPGMKKKNGNGSLLQHSLSSYDTSPGGGREQSKISINTGAAANLVSMFGPDNVGISGESSVTAGTSNNTAGHSAL